MLQTAKRAGQSASAETPPHERYLEAFRWMLQTRIFEEKLTSLYRGGMITGGVYVGRGQEAVSTACGLFLQKGDVFAPLIRDQAGRAAFGEPLLNVTRTYLGSRQGPMRGRDGNIHRGCPEAGQLAMISHLGAMIPVVVGKLLAKRMKGEKGFVGLTTIGEGGMQTGATHEGMNIAAVEKVPFVIVASNNHFAYSTPNDREFACAHLVDRARGYGYEGHRVDGTDLAACLEVIGGAVERARAGGPPQLVVASLLRLAGHGEHDDASYVPAKMKKERWAQDCVARTEQLILENNWARRRDAQADGARKFPPKWRRAVETAQREAAPVGERRRLVRAWRRAKWSRPNFMSITYLEAIREAQAHLLREDERVFIYGQDVSGKFGGAFKATKGLAEEFPGRVLNTPISEDAMVGTAIGAAMEGMRPIVEMQFADFSSVALNQILNNAGTQYWRTNIPCPITVRLPSGGTKGSGPFHSQSMEAIYSHYPGLVVVTPATVEDAYTMLIDAVAIDDPVIYCEHKYLYYHLKADALPKDRLPIGKARVVRPGRDLSIVTYSAMVHEALAVAKEFSAGGVEIEVVDLRSVKPLDTDTVLASVARTGRLLCVGEAFPWGGVTAEVIARVATEGFHLLDAAPARINAKDTPIPYHPNLWSEHRPNAKSIAAKARQILAE